MSSYNDQWSKTYYTSKFGSIKKLSNTNYAIWKGNVTVILLAMGAYRSSTEKKKNLRLAILRLAIQLLQGPQQPTTKSDEPTQYRPFVSPVPMKQPFT